MSINFEELDGSNPWLETKQDVRDNLAVVDRVHLLLKALAYGIEVQLDGMYYIMVDGDLGIKGISHDSITKQSMNTMMGINSYSYGWLVQVVKNTDPEWFEKLRAEVSIKATLNHLHGRFE